jgi:anaerobic magnesium-protoporphyrin IX monomethyl ester cyclase
MAIDRITGVSTVHAFDLDFEAWVQHNVSITYMTEKSTQINDLANDKDWAMIKVMKELARNVPQRNVTAVDIKPSTKKTTLALIMMPEWGIFFPPYNISRLSAVTRAAGYHTQVHDINVKAWHHMKDKLDFDPWDPSKEWLWIGKWYYNELHPHLQDFYMEYVDQIVASKPDVIGFSMYYTNEQATNWFSAQLKKRLPGSLIVVGGPQASVMDRRSQIFYHHIVEGEGEQVILDILEKTENKTPITEKFIKKQSNIRLDLDSLPFPDYSDYNMQEYYHSGGMSSEISRGCVAKCVFCTEVHFWKYRGRLAQKLLDEIEFQNKTYGLNFVWFIDSLVNGNLNQLRAFCLGVKDRNLNIKWQGYARCDGRMDLDYYKDMSASGCIQLSYGIESGSQKVLDDMKKEITIEEIESNMLSGSITNIQAHTNWIVGFPSEDHQAFADTLTLVWRIRNHNILTISPGLSLMLSPGSDISLDPTRFNVSDKNFLNMWTTNDLKNTKVHRLIRQKCFNIFLEQLNSDKYIYGFERPNLKNTYNITYNDAIINTSMQRETFNYDIIDTNYGDFANSLVNEIWPLLRCLYLALNAYSITVRFDPDTDLQEFGDRLGSLYTAEYRFVIDDKGSWSADFQVQFLHRNHDGSPDINWPDQSFIHSYQGSGTW